jgi:hypothetical protein
MLWRGEIGLSDANVTTELSVDDMENPQDREDGQNQMSPSAISMDSRNVSPAELIRAHCAVVAAEFVDGEKNGKDDDREGHKDFQQHAQESQEEVGVETALFDKGLVGRGEERDDPLPRALDRSGHSLALSDEVRLGPTGKMRVSQRSPLGQV